MLELAHSDKPGPPLPQVISPSNNESVLFVTNFLSIGQGGTQVAGGAGGIFNGYNPGSPGNFSLGGQKL